MHTGGGRFPSEEQMQEAVSRAQERARGASLRVLARTLSAPLEVDGIVRAAEQARPDVLIMGTHGHGNLSRALIGSVSSEVVRTLRFPVLLVPPGQR